MDNKKQGKEGVMNDGKTKSAAGLYTRVDLDEVLYTDNFSVCKNCIGCGKCSQICPAEAIKMKDEHPVWIKETCLMCFGCLRLCPTAAIRYGDIEQSKCAIAKSHKLKHSKQPQNAYRSPKRQCLIVSR